MSSKNNLSGSSGMSSSEIPSLPQCLPLDQITLGDQKYTRSGELRRVLGVPMGSTSEDHSFGVPQSKPVAPVASGELKHFKESVQDASRKARDRAKLFRQSLFKLDKYKEALSSKKRQRTDSPSDRGGGVNLTKMGNQIHRNLNGAATHRSEGKTSNSVMNKRIRTSVTDVRVEGRSATSGRQQMVTERDGNLIQMPGAGSVRVEEKTRRLLAGGEGLDHKIKKKRSVGAVGSTFLNGNKDIKRATLPKTSSDLKLRFPDAQGFRLKSLSGVNGVNKSEGSSEPTNSGAHPILGSEQEGDRPLHRDHMAASEQRVLSKNNRTSAQEDFPASSPTMIKNKVSRAPRTGSVTALELSSVQPSSNPGSSIHPMTQWVGQRPHKNSRSRRANVVSPVSRNVDAQVPSEGCTASEFSSRTYSVGFSGSQLASSMDNNNQKCKRPPDDISSPFGLSESEEYGAGESKIKEKGINSSDFALASEKAGASKLQVRKNKTSTDESRDSVQRQGRSGRILPLIRPGLPTTAKENSENLPLMKPVQHIKPNDKSKTKYGRPPSKKQKDRKIHARVGKSLNNSSLDFAGESDDDSEELYQAANSARSASNRACSSRFWTKMESIFASVNLEDASFLKQQLSFTEDLDGNLSQMDILINKEATQYSGERQRLQYEQEYTKTDALSGKNMERLEKATPLFQRLLSALIEEDESEESYHHNEVKNVSRQCASDDSHCGSCNQIDFEAKDWDKIDSEVESNVDFPIQKNCTFDRLSCDKSAASNTFRCPNTSSSLQSTGVWQGDEEFSLSDVTHTSGIYSNDHDQLQPAELSLPGLPSLESQYQLMCLDNRLLLELQSIGLYPEILPDLAEEDEAINQDITELEKGLHQQIGRKKKSLVEIDGAVQKGTETESRKFEQVAFDQLIEIAYRKRLACRTSKNSKSAVQKMAKQVALAFVKRTLGRCKKYEETGNSCFSESTLQHIILSTPSCDNDAKSAEHIVSGTASNTCNRVSHQVEPRKSGAVSSASEKHDSHSDIVVGGFPDSSQGLTHSSEQVSSKNGSPFIKEKRREMLVNGVSGTVHGGVKGKRSERDRNQSRDQIRQNSISRGIYQSLDSSQNEPKSKLKQKCNNNGYHGPSQSVANIGNGFSIEGATLSSNHSRSQVTESTDFGNLQLHELDSMEELGVSGELGGPQDINSWLMNFDEDGLQDDELIGLEIPMDDLSELNMF